jgi:hypothetical protein
MGESALKSHAVRTKHMSNEKSNPIMNLHFFGVKTEKSQSDAQQSMSTSVSSACPPEPNLDPLIGLNIPPPPPPLFVLL